MEQKWAVFLLPNARKSYIGYDGSQMSISCNRSNGPGKIEIPNWQFRLEILSIKKEPTFQHTDNDCSRETNWKSPLPDYAATVVTKDRPRAYEAGSMTSLKVL